MVYHKNLRHAGSERTRPAEVISEDLHEQKQDTDHEPPCRNYSSRRGCRRGFVARRAAAAVASLNRWRGMFRRAKCRRSSGSASKSASIKISTVSSLYPCGDGGRIAKVNLVASSVLASNDGVGHYRPAFSDRRRLRNHQWRVARYVYRSLNPPSRATLERPSDRAFGSRVDIAITAASLSIDPLL